LCCSGSREQEEEEEEEEEEEMILWALPGGKLAACSSSLMTPASGVNRLPCISCKHKRRSPRRKKNLYNFIKTRVRLFLDQWG
jgi:hypothetical protein